MGELLRPQLSDFGITLETDPNDRDECLAECPKCTHKRKTKANGYPLIVTVLQVDAFWICYNCGWAGSCNAGERRTSDPNAWMLDEWTRPTLINKRDWSKEQLDYIHLRGISDATIERNRLTIQRAWMPKLGDWANALTFPFYRAGELVNIKYRSKNKDMRLATNAELIFYGLDDITYQLDTGEIVPQQICYIVEGEMDKLAMDEAGFTNSISVPNGTASPATKDLDRHLRYIEHSNYKLAGDDAGGLLDRIQTFVIAVDSDEPGQRLQDQLVRRLGPERCEILRWPKWPLDREPLTLWDKKIVKPGDTLKDANEVLFALGVEGVQEAVRSARAVRMSGVWRVSDYKAAMDDYYEHGLPPGVPLPWKAFKDGAGKSCLQAKEQMTWVVTGLPSHGKSRWVENVCVELAREEGWRFGYFSAEVNPKQLHASYLMSQWAGQPFDVGQEQRMSRETYEQACKWHDDHFFYYETESAPFGIDDLLELGTKTVRKHGVNCIVIDPWNNVDHFTTRGKFDREDEYIQKAMLSINNWRTINNAMVIIVAHPKTLEVKHGKEPIPTLSNIAGGAKFRAMCDVGISVWRDIMDETTPTRIIVQKVKFHHLGTFGQAQMNFDKPTSKFYDAGISYEGVRTKETNRGDAPRFEPPVFPEEGPWWMQGPEYDV